MRKVDGTWLAFLAMAFGVVGLTGLLATFAAPLPLQRALLRDQALDEVLAASSGADPRATIETLRPQLAESADALLPGQPDLAEQIARERMAMHVRFAAEAEATTTRLRWLISVCTLAAALFGAAILGAASRQRR